MNVFRSIQNRNYELRGERIMLDFDVAELYEVETKILNRAVKQNIKRFPKELMFRLTSAEWKEMQSQIPTTVQTKRATAAAPYAFTNQGVAMLCGILKSDKAIAMNIAIMQAFIGFKRILGQENRPDEPLKLMKESIGEYSSQLNQIHESLENLLNGQAGKRKWVERNRLGFRISEQ